MLAANTSTMMRSLATSVRRASTAAAAADKEKYKVVVVGAGAFVIFELVFHLS